MIKRHVGVAVVPGEEPCLGEPRQVLQAVQLPDPLGVSGGNPVIDPAGVARRPLELAEGVVIPIDGVGQRAPPDSRNR